VLEIEVGGHVLRLLAQRAAGLPARRLLLVADAHLGKASSFRRLGVPVPEATTAATLERLSQAIAAAGATGVVFLGDLLHARHGRTAATLEAVRRWRRERHAELELTLVRGNHDDRAGDPPADWGVRCVDGPLLVDGLALAHQPEARPGAYVLAGHVHPAALVGGRGPGRLRLPCFHFGASVGVLPAFGDFTGSHVLPRAPGDRVIVIAGDALRELPASPPRAESRALHCVG
jgi:DNA ligase-associated metallophosphoesterase